MKRYLKIGVVFMLFVVFAAGCGAEREAIKMQDDGVWKERLNSCSNTGSNEVRVKLLIDVKKDMTEKEMLTVLDYYEIKIRKRPPLDIGENDFIQCYAIFYKDDTEEIIKKYKYREGECLDITTDDEIIFKSLELDGKSLENDEY